MSGNNISPNKRRPFPQFGGRKAAVTARELQSSFDALPGEKPTTSGQPKPEVKPAPARTVRPSSEADFKRWLASQSQLLLPANASAVRPVPGKSGVNVIVRAQIVCTANQSRYRYETSSDKSGEDASSSIIEAESQSHAGLNAGSDSLGSHSRSYSESGETDHPRGRKSSAGASRPQVPVPPLALNRVRRTAASADRIVEPRRRLEKSALQSLAHKRYLHSSLVVLNSILRIAVGSQKNFSQNLHQLLANLTANQRDALAWFETQTQNGSGKNLGKWSEFAGAVNQSIQLIDDAANGPRPGDEDRGSEDESNAAYLALRRAPESSTLFDFVQANRDLRLF